MSGSNATRVHHRPRRLWRRRGTRLGRVRRPGSRHARPRRRGRRRAGAAQPPAARARCHAPARRLSAAGCSCARSSGVLEERSAGKDTTTGHWELVGVLTTTPPPTYPDGFPAGPARQRFIRRIGRGVLGNTVASGTGDHRRVRRRAPADRRPDRLHERRLGLPDRRARGRDPARASSTTTARSRASCSSASTPSAA